MELTELLKTSALSLRKEDLASLVGSSPERFKELISLALSNDMPVCWRAAWIADYLAELEPSLPGPYLDSLWEELGKDHPDGVKRSILRMLGRYDIPEERQGMATDLCLDWLQQESVPVAIKAHAMEVLFRIVKLYPELKDEFIAVLEEQAPNNSAGFKARAAILIKAMNKI